MELVKSVGFSQTVKESIISDADKNGEGGLRVDCGVRGVLGTSERSVV